LPYMVKRPRMQNKEPIVIIGISGCETLTLLEFRD
jgi:hypothetical protein